MDRDTAFWAGYKVLLEKRDEALKQNELLAERVRLLTDRNMELYALLNQLCGDDCNLGPWKQAADELLATARQPL